MNGTGKSVKYWEKNPAGYHISWCSAKLTSKWQKRQTVLKTIKIYKETWLTSQFHDEQEISMHKGSMLSKIFDTFDLTCKIQ